MEIIKQLNFFKIIEDKTGWKDRVALLNCCYKELGLKGKDEYWMLRTKTAHLSMEILNSILIDSKGDKKDFFYRAKNCGKKV